MKKIILLGFISAASLFCLSCVSEPEKPAPSAPAAGRCATRFPILLVHGISLRDDYPIPYWGRIPETLAAEGATVYLANHDAWGSIEDNAAALSVRIDEIRAATGAEKVNIIAHSKGGLESRYLVSSLGKGGEVASLTTICTPHRGAPFADLILDEVPVLNDATGLIVDTVSLFFLRDMNPNVRWATDQLRPSSMAAFNQNNPDDPRVYYQSWTSKIDSDYPVPVYALVYEMTAEKGGPNDGIVPVESAIWGNYRGLIGDGSELSHSDVHDYKVFSFPGVYDVRPFYVEMAAELKAKGF